MKEEKDTDGNTRVRISENPALNEDVVITTSGMDVALPVGSTDWLLYEILKTLQALLAK